MEVNKGWGGRSDARYVRMLLAGEKIALILAIRRRTSHSLCICLPAIPRAIEKLANSSTSYKRVPVQSICILPGTARLENIDRLGTTLACADIETADRVWQEQDWQHGVAEGIFVASM